MALYAFVGFLCSFIAVDITKFLISKNTSGFPYALNVVFVFFLSIAFANLLGIAWLWIYSELIIKVWFLDFYHFGKMFIAFLGSSLWTSIIFVSLFLYRHIKNKTNNRKWIYTASLAIIFIMPLVNIVQYGEREESKSLISQSTDSIPKNDIEKEIIEMRKETDLIVLEQIKLEEEMRQLEALNRNDDLKLQIAIMKNSSYCSEAHLGNGGYYVDLGGKIYELKNGVNDKNYVERKAEFIDCMTTLKKIILNKK